MITWGDTYAIGLGQNGAFKTVPIGEFCGGPVVRTVCFHCRGSRFNPWLGDCVPVSLMAQPKKESVSERDVGQSSLFWGTALGGTTLRR